MKILSELFDGGSPRMQRKKKITFYMICVTFALLVALLLFLLGVVIVSSVRKAPGTTDPEENTVSIGTTQTVVLNEADIYSGELLLLNAENPLRTEVKVGLISADRPKTEQGSPVYSVKGTQTLSLTADALKQFNLLAESFYKQSGDDNLLVVNAYDAAKSSQSAIYAAGNTLALGYYSQNKDGDIERNESIYDVEKYKWIYSNAYKYGFVSISSETHTDADGNSVGSNVFRYVGVVHSTAITVKRLSFEGYLEHLKTKTTPETPLSVKVGTKSYAIYYLSADSEHKVPTEYEYSVSGNNTDGYIVTVELSKKVTQ